MKAILQDVFWIIHANKGEKAIIPRNEEAI